jgi:uncharacterized damage-inducible protein DinB
MTGGLLTGVQTALIEELESLRDGVLQVVQGLSDQQLWHKPLEQSNSVGHLVLHLTGNLNYFVGAQMGGTGYVRDRENEFTESQPPSRDVLLANLNGAVATFRQVVSKLDAERFTAPHPETRFGSVVKTLVHLLNHFALHRGQMSYLVRLLPKG